MSRAIAALLDQPEPVVKKSVAILEAKNGYPSHDVRHLAENIQKIRTKLSDLGLDPNDTTAKELYHALLIKFQADSQQFESQFDSANDTYDQKVAKAVELISKKIKLPEIWSLKAHSAKELLKKNPPKKIMKHLGYRSIDSLIKRQDLAELHLMMDIYESSTWNKAYQKKVNSLDSTHFELHPLRIVGVSQAKWDNIGGEDLVSFKTSFGCMGLMPDQKLGNASLLTIVVTILDGISMFGDTNLSAQTVKLSSIAAWWEDMDGLVASLAGGNVSLNIKDVASNHISTGFDKRQLDCARRSFWRGLVSRYENLLAAEEDLMMSFDRKPILITPPVHRPAFEFAEDL